MVKSAKRIATEKATYLRRMADPEYRKDQLKRYKAWYEINKDNPKRLARKAKQMRGYTKNLIQRPKHQARWASNKAVEAGKIKKQPCYVCGSFKSEKHHQDYTKPLEVKWYCRKHHRELHAKAEGEIIMKTKDTTENLCDTCVIRNMPECIDNKAEFGNGYGNDNIIKCDNYQTKTEGNSYGSHIDVRYR